tara:strand:- start:29 stop:403 length:375 start_codon:yes stop_codon:yes gene_type:complete
MLEVVLGSVVLLIVLVSALEGYLTRLRLSNELKKEGDLVKENLNHLAGAIISLSELLDDADQVIENISQVPTVGEMIQQALMGFITQKMQGVLPEPIIQPMEQVIKEKVVEVVHGEEKRPKEND